MLSAGSAHSSSSFSTSTPPSSSAASAAAGALSTPLAPLRLSRFCSRLTWSSHSTRMIEISESSFPSALSRASICAHVSRGCSASCSFHPRTSSVKKALCTW